MSYLYKVPIIPQNLNRQETIIQVAEVLNHLSKVTDDILRCINARIELNKNKMVNISERIAKVDSKICKLTGAKKATQIFSSCKYPASDVNQQYSSIFSEAQPIELVRHKVKRRKMRFNDEHMDKLHVYHVKLKKDNIKETTNGLGDFPNDMDCVNDLLLYNSGKNLYKNFVMSDALQMSQNTREREEFDRTHIGAAPHSISERTTLTRSSTQTYFYTPNLGEVPALDVPLDLPDLPGIADDLRYDTELGPGIAPSVTTTPNFPDLPVIDEHTESQSKTNDVQVELPPPPPPVVEKANIEAEVKTESDQIVKINTEVELHLPNVAIPSINTNRMQEIQEPQKPLELPQLDVHASLMQAIRNAGGSKNAKLKSASAPSQNEPVKATSGNDLMSDLHAKLSLRRKGISGAKKQQMDAGSAMERISAMIPPPIANLETNDATTEDEDWED